MVNRVVGVVGNGGSSGESSWESRDRDSISQIEIGIHKAEVRGGLMQKKYKVTALMTSTSRGKRERRDIISKLEWYSFTEMLGSFQAHLLVLSFNKSIVMQGSDLVTVSVISEMGYLIRNELDVPNEVYIHH